MRAHRNNVSVVLLTGIVAACGAEKSHAGDNHANQPFTVRPNAETGSAADGGVEPESDTDSQSDVADEGGDGDTSPVGGERCDDTGDLPLGELLGDTDGHLDDFNDNCPTAEDGEATTDGPDVAYRFVPRQDGLLRLFLVAGEENRWDTVLRVRRSCAEPDVACNDDYDHDDDGTVDIGWSRLELCVAAGETYFVLVDGFAAEEYGRFVLTSEIDPCDEVQDCC